MENLRDKLVHLRALSLLKNTACIVEKSKRGSGPCCLYSVCESFHRLMHVKGHHGWTAVEWQRTREGVAFACTTTTLRLGGYTRTLIHLDSGQFRPPFKLNVHRHGHGRGLCGLASYGNSQLVCCALTGVCDIAIKLLL